MLSAALSTNGTYLATGGDEGKTRIWRVSDGVRVMIGGPENEQVFSVTFRSDDSYLAIGRSDGINVTHAPAGPGIGFNEPPGAVSGVCFSPDGTTLASANEFQTASLWSVPDGNWIRDFTGHSDKVYSVAFSPDGQLLATSSGDATVRLWNVTNGVCQRVIDIGGGSNVKFSGNGKLLFTLVDGVFKIYRAVNGALVGSITNSGAVTFDVSKNGKYLAYGRDDYSVVLARTPLVIDEFTRTGNETVLHWQGGSGLYQLQSNTNFTTNSWQNLGPATTNTVATNVSSSTLFFRVQSLPNP